MGASELRAHPWWTDSFMVTFAFHCNVACTFCMVEDVLDVLPGTTQADFRAALQDPELLRGVRRIIFSGGEVTLAPDLLAWVELARSLPGIEHVRIQTNAIRLVRRDLVRDLQAAGLDEVFVSLHAHDEALGDALLQRKGAFKAIQAGLDVVASSGLELITNTAIVAPNHRHLPEIIELGARFSPRSMELWNYWPRADERGERQLAAPIAAVRPFLLAALDACGARGIPPVVKWFPRCLLGEWAFAQDDGQPPALLSDSYWSREPDYACLYEGVCADAKACSGLSHPYVERFGWEQELLQPRRTKEPGTPLGDPRRSLVSGDTALRAKNVELARWLERIGVSAARRLAGFRLTGATRATDPREIALRFMRPDGLTVEARLRPHDPRRPYFLRTRSFDLGALEPPAGRELEQAALLRALGHALSLADRDGLTPP